MEKCDNCDTAPAGELDECPFKVEIDGDHDLCNCCDYCRQRCSDDI